MAELNATDARCDPHTRGACPLTLDELAPLIAELLRAYSATAPGDPRTGMAPRDPSGKDVEARAALQLAGYLLRPLMMWALNHQVGLLLNGVETAPLPPRGAEEGAVYVGATRAADDHAHEIAGAAFDGTSPEVTRRAVALALRSLLPDWPPAVEIADALNALALGEVRPVLAPPIGKRARGGSPSALWAYRMSAIRLAAMLEGAEGLTREAARAMAAEAFGQDAATLKSWETKLPRRIGPVAAHDLVVRSRAIGGGGQGRDSIESLRADGAAFRAKQSAHEKGKAKRRKRRGGGALSAA